MLSERKEIYEKTGKTVRLPKVGSIKIRQHRPIPEEFILKSVTVSMEGSGVYYASLLYEYYVSESQTAGSILRGG